MIEPYSGLVEGWVEKLKKRWLLLDADAFMSILEFRAGSILDELKNEGCEFTYIHPVYLELMRTNRSKDKLQRSKLIDDYNFSMLSLTKNEVENAKKIQNAMPIVVQPSPTDLYLAGTLAHYSSSQPNMLLVTSNLKDFPHPIFTRECFVHLQNERHIKVLSFLSIDNTRLS